jgi:hypothetical protein
MWSHVILRLCSDSNGSSTSKALYAVPFDTDAGTPFVAPVALGGTMASGAPFAGAPLSATMGAMYIRTGSLRLRIIFRSYASPTVVDTKLLVTLYVFSARSTSPHSATMYPRRMIKPDAAPRTTNGPNASLCGSVWPIEATWFCRRSFGVDDSEAMAIFTAESTEACWSPTCAGVRFSQAPTGG